MKINHLIALISIILSIALNGCQPPNQGHLPDSLNAWYQVPTGVPVRVVMTAYKTTMLADGGDETLLRICLADSNGMEILDANRTIQVHVHGEATIHRGNGEPMEHRRNEDGSAIYESRITNGNERLILRSGSIPDRIQLEVRADSLWPATHEIHTIPASTEMLTPSSSLISRSTRPIFKMLGADISFLPQLEDRGMKFYENGVEKDAIRILADHGFNTIRLRIFVNPENENGYAPGTGYCGLDYTSRMARRAKEAGLKLLLNFHYSDYWADPQQQNKPLSWSKLNYDSLLITLKEYTARVILHLIEQGTRPEMVQVGNEINHGMLWPEGHISNPDQLAGLLKAGVEGVRSVDPSIIVMMHIALGGQNEEARFWLDNMMARGVEFDILGLSYYPRWHGTLDDMNRNMRDLVNRYQKDVNVVEYSQFKREIHDIVFALPEEYGKGTCIWEPLNFWGALFDRKGEVLDHIHIYDSISARYYTP
jgi:beta-galactosidase